jgi:hypothetical protein
MNCTDLKKAVLSTKITEIPDTCFSVCTALESVNISENVTRIGNHAFFGCGNLSGVYIPGSVTEIGEDAVGTHYNIRLGKNVPYPEFYISGDTGSAAEAYAKIADLDFIDFANIRHGDVDRNGTVDAIDASMVLTEYANVAIGREASFGDYQRAAADYNQDGSVDALDASLILSEYANNATK